MPNEAARQVAIEAKHLRPRLGGVSLRADAREAFAAAFGRRLAVVCAPAGYGKTTTTAAALEHCGRTAAWYKLDVLDHDPLAFLAAMTRAVQRLSPEFGAALLRELESGPVLDLPVEVLAARFCSECDQLVTSDHHLVLDDYHEAMDSAALNNVLGYLLENCPATIHFVVLTRYEPVFRLEKLHLAGEVTRLPRDLLLFDATQVAEILAQRSGRDHDPAHVRRLLELTEGWPASVVLAGMALAWLDVSSLEEALGDPRMRSDVFSYLAEQVFQGQADEVQTFLLGTCCLEHVSGELAEALTGSGDASRHLHFLARNHIFTFETERAGTYRYHNLLRDFLRQRFVHDEGESAFRALQRRTAAALEECGDRPSAVELLLGANELELALDAIARGGEAELERRPSEQLRIWVGKLAPAVESGHPWALVVSAVVAIRESRFVGALGQLESAVRKLEMAGDADGLYQALSVLEWAQFWSGDPSGSMATCTTALKYARKDSERVHTLLSLLSAALDMRRWDEVEAASAKADRLLPHAKPDEAARAQALRAHAAYFQGDMHLARSLVQRYHDHGSRAAQRAAALNISGMIETALGSYESAGVLLGEAAEIASDFGHALTSYMIEDSRACLAGAMGHIEACLSALETLSSDSAHVQEPSLQAYALCHHGTALRRSGSLVGSMESTRRAIHLAPAERDPYLALNASANLAYSEGLLGKVREPMLQTLSKLAKQRGLQLIELKAMLYMAVLSYMQDDKKRAVGLLESCLPRQLRLGHVNVVAQELSPHPKLVAEIIKRDRCNGLGPPLVEGLSHHWDFAKAAETLRLLGPSQVNTWIGHVQAGRTRTGPISSSQQPLAEPGSGTGAKAKHELMRQLTTRETQILGLIALDLTNEEIANELFISVATVKTHVNHILRKLGQRSRVGAILEYQRATRLSGDDPPKRAPNIQPRTSQ